MYKHRKYNNIVKPQVYVNISFHIRRCKDVYALCLTLCNLEEVQETLLLILKLIIPLCLKLHKLLAKSCPENTIFQISFTEFVELHLCNKIKKAGEHNGGYL